MKRFFFGIAALFIAAHVNAQNNEVVYDTAKFEQLNEVVVSSVRVQKSAPFAATNIKKVELNDFSKTGHELPFLFAKTPGIIAWSENGVGSGTSYMRIRGAGDSRINVTLDGVSLNSPEDQCVFWANMNSYGSLLSSVQIQRGVGTSTNGDGAFGGTISLTSATPSFVPSAEVTGSYGSFSTTNFGAKASTGLLWKHLIIDGAFHQTNTDGFVHGTKGRSGSYYGGLTWMGKNFVIRYKNIGNFERTGQAWNGVVAGNNDYSMNARYGSSSSEMTSANAKPTATAITRPCPASTLARSRSNLPRASAQTIAVPTATRPMQSDTAEKIGISKANEPSAASPKTRPARTTSDRTKAYSATITPVAAPRKPVNFRFPKVMLRWNYTKKEPPLSCRL